MKKFPNKIKYKKPHQKILFKGSKGRSLSIFTTGLKLKEHINLTYDQLEAARKSVARRTRKKKRINEKNLRYIRGMAKQKSRKQKPISVQQFLSIKSHFFQSLTRKPLQTRMGKGKGSPAKWVYPCQKHRVFTELSLRKRSLSKIHSWYYYFSIKIPRATKFIFSRRNLVRETKYKMSKSSREFPRKFG
jgi:large subunit ribosomal protein L16